MSTPESLTDHTQPFQAHQREPVAPLTLSICFGPLCQQSNRWDSQCCSQCGSPLRLKDQYRATRLLRGGKFSLSYLAVDEHHAHRICVIKQFFLPQETVAPPIVEQAAALFRQEAVILQKLGIHPQIPALLTFFEEDNRLYIVQEFVEGQSLFQGYRQNAVFNAQYFNAQYIERLLKELLPVLQYVHDHQIVHRDIKPGNIIQPPSGPLHLIDFGGAYHPHFGPCGRVGTPGYAAPEQFQGHTYPASDLFSLGMTCLRLLAQQMPLDSEPDSLFDAQSQRQLWQQVSVMVRPALASILERLIQPDVKSRYQSAQEVLTDLKGQPSRSQSGLMRSDAVNYDRLTHLLAQADYQAADEETWRLLLALGKEEPSSQGLSINAIANLSMPEVHMLDRLWQVSSGGRFGFTIQHRLYQHQGALHDFDYGTWQRFAGQVGWYQQGEWVQYGDLNFTENAAVGHLPASFASLENRVSGTQEAQGWWRLGFVFFMERLSQAKI